LAETVVEPDAEHAGLAWKPVDLRCCQSLLRQETKLLEFCAGIMIDHHIHIQHPGFEQRDFSLLIELLSQLALGGLRMLLGSYLCARVYMLMINFKDSGFYSSEKGKIPPNTLCSSTLTVAGAGC
jgi:hypothetical protein